MLARKVMLVLMALVFWWGATPATNAQETQDTAVVHVVMFWMEGCPYCHDVIDYILPPLQAEYGERLNVRLVELETIDDVDRLYELAQAAGLARNQVGVPLMLAGDRVLIGPYEIRDELPGIVEAHLPLGGLALPTMPQLTPLLDKPPVEAPPPLAIAPAQLADGRAVVRAVMFSTDTCPYCHQVKNEVLPVLAERYGDQLEILIIDLTGPEQAEAFYQAGEATGLPRNRMGVPLMIVGDQALIGPYQIRDELPLILDHYLPDGGLDYPQLPALLPLLPHDTTAAEPVTEPEVAEPVTQPDITAPAAAPVAPTGGNASSGMISDGFTLAILILVGMVVALAYTAVRFWQARQGKPLPAAPGWLMTGLPLIALIGLGVAGYLAYIETQPVVPICGPVGDCQAVQQSEYAYLFGIPIGVLGVIGYVAILGAWLWGVVKNDNRAFLLLLGMTSFGVLFSIYLTYLEPFVIGAVCAWCLTSAVIMTALMLMSLPLVDEKSLVVAK
jgi:uncharacterized membrane protein/glutaredoxin